MKYTKEQIRALTHSALGAKVRYAKQGKDKRTFLYYNDGFRAYLDEKEMYAIEQEIATIEKYNDIIREIKDESFIYSQTRTRKRRKEDKL